MSKVDPWFLDQIRAIVEERARLAATGSRRCRAGTGAGPSGWASATPSWPGSGRVDEAEVRAPRLAAGVRATFKTVDTCAAEFEASTPYHYSTYEDADEVRPSTGPRSSSSGRAPTASGRASSSTTAASTPASPSGTPATRP